MTIPAYQLTMTTGALARQGKTAVLGRDIRSQPSEIARHCLANHRGISEDIATVAESIALADRLFPRYRSNGWSRSITLEIPVFELATFRRREVVEALDDAVHFLTGDLWHIQFIQRSGQPLSQAVLPFERVEYRFVTPYSDGLDSFAQATLLASQFGERSILKLRSARIGQDSARLKQPVLRVPRSLGSMPKKEQTYRSRPFVFFSFAGIGAFVAGAEAIVVGESGQGALGPALLPYGGEWPFRSTHPGFLKRMERYLSLAFSRETRVDQPQLWRTKGEVLRLLQEKELLGRWQETRSCSLRPANKHGARACGFCGGCMLRGLAIHSAGFGLDGAANAFNLMSVESRAIDGIAMSAAERHMAARSMGTMAEFASLARDERGPSLLESESMLFGESDPVPVARKLYNLASRHAAEWQGLVAELPMNGWARAIAVQL
jgi:7-cyano-7-deazaguanine synthase in queuosine biosynthesis